MGGQKKIEIEKPYKKNQKPTIFVINRTDN